MKQAPTQGPATKLFKPLRLALGAAALSWLAAPGWATVYIVDASGGTGSDFIDIQVAVDAAVAGDTLYIRPGVYSSFTISGKPLTLARQGAGIVRVNGQSGVWNIPNGSGVQLDGLELFGTEEWWPALRIDNCAGPVWLSDCHMKGWLGVSPSSTGGSGVHCSSSHDVGLIRCELEGGRGGDGTQFWLSDGGYGGHGLFADASNARLFECTVTSGAGGHAGSGSSALPGYAGAGIRAATGATVFVSESTVVARHHGWPSSNCGPPLWSVASSVRQYESVFWTHSCPQAPPIDVPSADTTTFCFGTPSACPCTNQGSGGNGCANSYATGGGTLALSGNASLSADTVTLHHTGIAAGIPLLFFQGTLDATGGLGAQLGDGLLCAGGSVLRLATRISDGGETSYGYAVPTDPSISLSGQVPAMGATRYYQVWYRDPNAACATGQFNLSNGITVPWRP